MINLYSIKILIYAKKKQMTKIKVKEKKQVVINVIQDVETDIIKLTAHIYLY